MVVKNMELIEDLAQKLKKDKKWIEKELAILVDEIKAKTSSGKTVTIDKFGTFSDKSERLSFDIDETLALEINYKYAGMEPIELVSAIDEQEESDTSKKEPDIIEEETEDVFGIKSGTDKAGDQTKDKELTKSDSEKKAKAEEATDEKANAEETADQKREPPKKEKGKNNKSEEEKRWEDAFGIIEPDLSDSYSKSGKAKTGDEPEKKKSPVKETSAKEEVSKVKETPKPAHKPAKKAEKTTPVATKTTPPKPKPVAKKKRRRSKYSHRQQSGALPVFLTLIISAVIIAGVLYLVYPNFFKSGTESATPNIGATANQGNGGNPVQPKPEPAQSSADMGGNNGTATGNESGATPKVTDNTTSSGNTEARSDVKETNKIISELQSVSLYGLKGKGLSNKTNFYGIILYSLSTNVSAKKEQSSLSGMGFRSFVVTVNVGGKQHWRVGVGQFPNVASAKQAVTRLPDPYQKNYFIKYIHIQPNQ